MFLYLNVKLVIQYLFCLLFYILLTLLFLSFTLLYFTFFHLFCFVFLLVLRVVYAAHIHSPSCSLSFSFSEPNVLLFPLSHHIWTNIDDYIHFYGLRRFPLFSSFFSHWLLLLLYTYVTFDIILWNSYESERAAHVVFVLL